MNRRNFFVGALTASAFSSSTARGVAAKSRAAGQTSATSPVAASVQILVFDTFGTVVDWRSSVIAEGEKLGREKKLKADWAAFADAWRAGYAPAMNRVRKGELPWTKLDVLHRMTLDELLVRFEIEGLSEDEKQHLNRVWHRLRPWPDAVAGLSRLKTRYVIAPLSNGNVSLLTNMAKQAALPWDCILSTELVRHYKPDKETYLMAPELWDVAPSAVMMVAAHVGDLDSAQKLGLRTAFVHRPLEFGPSRAADSPVEGRFDFTTKDFLDLATQLGV